MSVRKDLGMVTAYAYAVSKGYTGTEDEFAALMADYADVGERAEAAATAAAASATAASGSASDSAASATAAEGFAGNASTSAGNASQAAQNANQSATDADGSATAAAGSATAAAGSATTAGNKATEAAQSATEAAASATTAESAKTAAQAAQTAAETAQTAAEDAQAAAEAAAQTLVIDPTLTQPNQAAEAKATGDAISLVRSRLDAFSEDGTAANAKQLLTDKGITESVPYLFRKSGGDGADREFDTVVGGTVAWNQIIYNGNFAANDAWTMNRMNLSVSDNIGTFSIISSTYNFAGFYQNIDYISDHTYLASVSLSTDANSAKFFSLVYGGKTVTATASYAWTNLALIVKNLTSRAFNPGIRYETAADVTVGDKLYAKNAMLFDLTQMFGTAVADYIYDLETAHAGDGVAFFRSLFPEDYYPYDTGTLKSVEGVSAHEMVGFNLFDKSTVSTGAKLRNDGTLTTSTWSCVSDYISVIPGQSYYVSHTIGASAGIPIAYYDDTKAFLRIDSASGSDDVSAVFTVPSNCKYMKCTIANVNLDISCVSFSSPRNGEYEPYQKHTYALDDSLTLRGIPKLDSNNKLYYDGDTYAADGTVTRRYRLFDLGSTNYVKSTSGLFQTTALQSVIKRPASSAYVGHVVLSTMYLEINSNDITGPNGTNPSPDMVMAVNGQGLIYINNLSYTDVADFKAAMSGVYLVYELATPTTETAEPFQSPQICSHYGTEEYITTGIVPVGHSTFYPENLRAKIEELPSNFSTLIAPTESTFTASRNYTTGALFIVNNILYKATANIANGGTITPGTNCTATTLAEIISALA